MITILDRKYGCYSYWNQHLDEPTRDDTSYQVFYADYRLFGLVPIWRKKFYKEDVPVWARCMGPLGGTTWESKVPNEMHLKCRSRLVEKIL